MENSSSSSASAGRKRRSLLNIQLVPNTRMRLTFVSIAVGCFAAAMLTLSAVELIENRLGEITSLADFRSDVFLKLGFAAFFAFYATLGTLFFSVLMSHRVYGPMVPIKRMLEALAKGEYSTRGRLRPSDELQDLMNALNKLAEELERRHGPSVTEK